MTPNALPSWRRWLALITIVAQALLLTATLWHAHAGDHHECDSEHREDHCAVCFAVAVPRPDPAPPVLPIWIDAPLIATLDDAPAAQPAHAIILAARPRGPPLV